MGTYILIEKQKAELYHDEDLIRALGIGPGSILRMNDMMYQVTAIGEREDANGGEARLVMLRPLLH